MRNLRKMRKNQERLAFIVIDNYELGRQFQSKYVLEKLGDRMAEADENELIPLRHAKLRRERDFVALFNALWYRDFPIIRGQEKLAARAMWTTHIASVVKQCADLMGLFTLFETGNRTDAVIRKPLNQPSTNEDWAKVEWEWKQAFGPRVDEIEKLAKSAQSEKSADVFVFIGYSSEAQLNDSLKRIEKDWNSKEKHLLVFLIVFSGPVKKRIFRTIQTFRFNGGAPKKLRIQHALPWEVPDSRWFAIAHAQSAEPSQRRN